MSGVRYRVERCHSTLGRVRTLGRSARVRGRLTTEPSRVGLSGSPGEDTGCGGSPARISCPGTQVNSARHTDFIFSVLGEEWGCVGVVILLALFLFLIVEFLSLAKMSRDRGGTFSVLSLICFFIFHVIINVSMQIGVLPVTGIPLPLVSYGGAATMLFFTAIGLILNVDFRRFVNS